jgi:hypothetical protein
MITVQLSVPEMSILQFLVKLLYQACDIIIQWIQVFVIAL